MAKVIVPYCNLNAKSTLDMLSTSLRLAYLLPPLAVGIRRFPQLLMSKRLPVAK